MCEIIEVSAAPLALGGFYRTIEMGDDVGELLLIKCCRGDFGASRRFRLVTLLRLCGCT